MPNKRYKRIFNILIVHYCCGSLSFVILLFYFLLKVDIELRINYCFFLAAQSTHKWMVYVRGPRERPSLSHVVEKVWFFLHPSYKPNDLVEIKAPPFHLTRRGMLCCQGMKLPSSHRATVTITLLPLY